MAAIPPKNVDYVITKTDSHIFSMFKAAGIIYYDYKNYIVYLFPEKGHLISRKYVVYSNSQSLEMY